MGYMPLNKRTYGLLTNLSEKIGEEGWTHEAVKEFMGMDLNIRMMYRYLRKVDLTYDYQRKIWRHKKANPGPYHRMVKKLQGVYKKLGIPFDPQEVMSGGQKYDRFHGQFRIGEGLHKSDG